MSEYQRYEFITSDRPLTREQLDEVNTLSSHIEASSTHALIEYHWGDFKYDPIKVLHDFFDGFLYWANWGGPELALRFPHGILPADLIDGYDFADFTTFTMHDDYDILDIHLGELEAPEEWSDYELGSLIDIREELMNGDLRALYIAWLATQQMLGSYDEEEAYHIDAPPVPSGFGNVTKAQQALAQLLQVPQELLAATAQHSSKESVPQPEDDIATWVKSLPPERRDDYLVRLAHNEHGLSRLLVRELRERNQNKNHTVMPTGERVTYATLLAESKALELQWEREEQEQRELAHQRHIQDTHERQDDYWYQVDQAVTRGSGAGYDEAVRLLIDLREAASQFQASPEFQERFSAWIRPYLRRYTLIERLQASQFSWPKA